MPRPGNEWEIRYLDRVAKQDIPSLDVSVRVRIRKAIETKLSSTPELYGKPLRFSLKGARSLRVGDYRVLFVIERRHVLVIGIFHRSVAYLRAEGRIEGA